MSEENYIIVGVNDFEETTSECPIVYTTDILTCIAALMHMEESSVLVHIEATKDGFHDKVYKDLIDEVGSEIRKIELFTGTFTKEEHLSALIEYAENKGIDVSSYPSATDIYGNGSIGFDFSSQKHYGIMMENGTPIFENYDINRGRK